MKYLITTVIMLTAAVYSNTAFAWEANKPYIKSSVGQFNYVISWNVTHQDGDVFVEVEDDTISFDINAGFPFTDKLAIEGGFSFLTEADWRDGTPNGNVDAYALTLALVSRIPISNNFSFLGKVGTYHWEVELTEATRGLSAEFDDTDILSGIGVDFRINETTFFVIGYDSYHDAGNFAHIGLRFNL